MKSVNKLKPEDIEGAQDKEGNTGDNNIRVEMPFIRLMTELFEESIIDELMQSMLAHIRMQGKKPLNVWEWFYTRSNHTPEHQFASVSVNTRWLLYCASTMDSKKGKW